MVQHLVREQQNADVIAFCLSAKLAPSACRNFVAAVPIFENSAPHRTTDKSPQHRNS